MAKKVVRNLDKVIKSLRKFGEDGARAIEIEAESTAREIEADAKKRAPIYIVGTLRRSIKALEIDKKNWKIQANATGNAPYAAYIEFGTGGNVNVPAELSGIAVGFKGFTGRRINLKPQPYLYPAFVKGRKQYLIDLENKLDELSEKA